MTYLVPNYFLEEKPHAVISSDSLFFNKNIIFLLSFLFFVGCTQKKLDSKYADIDFQNITIKEFLQKVSKITEKKIVYNGEIKGKINFVSNELVLKTELIALTNAILETKHLTLVNKGHYYEIVKVENVICCGPNEMNFNGAKRTVVFELDDSNATLIQRKIKPLLSKNAKVIFSKENNLLIITDYKITLRSIAILIEKLKELNQ